MKKVYIANTNIVIYIIFLLFVFCLCASIILVHSETKREDILRKFENQKSKIVEKQKYFFEPQISTLKGEIKKLCAYGPPNYGENPETDKKISYFILELDYPISVIGNPNDSLNAQSYDNISTIQIIPGSFVEDIKKMINKKMVIEGFLFTQISGHHFTNVLISVQSIKELIETK